MDSPAIKGMMNGSQNPRGATWAQLRHWVACVVGCMATCLLGFLLATVDKYMMQDTARS